MNVTSKQIFTNEVDNNNNNLQLQKEREREREEQPIVMCNVYVHFKTTGNDLFGCFVCAFNSVIDYKAKLLLLGQHRIHIFNNTTNDD